MTKYSNKTDPYLQRFNLIHLESSVHTVGLWDKHICTTSILCIPSMRSSSDSNDAELLGHLHYRGSDDSNDSLSGQ